MKRVVVLAALALPVLLSGCLNWQGTYDNAARAECQRIIDSTERQACLNRVVENSHQRAAENRAR
jgi:hypothetical protein